MELVADRSHLGTADPTPGRIGLPDGRVAPHFDVLGDLPDEVHSFDDFSLAPWSRHGHPDRDACGEAVRRDTISTGPDRLQYVVWAWRGPTPRPALDRTSPTEMVPARPRPEAVVQ